MTLTRKLPTPWRWSEWWSKHVGVILSALVGICKSQSFNSLPSLFQSDTIRNAQNVTVRLWLIWSVVWLHKIWDFVVMKTHDVGACCLVDVYQNDALLPWRQGQYISPTLFVPDCTPTDYNKSPHLFLSTVLQNNSTPYMWKTQPIMYQIFPFLGYKG